MEKLKKITVRSTSMNGKVIQGWRPCPLTLKEQNDLLDKHGPEGLYILAEALIKLADKDVAVALEQCKLDK